MKANTQISNIDDIKKLVDTFYDKVREDKLLAPVFDERIQNNWQQHLQKMYHFWQTLLLGEHTYFGTPFPPHAELSVEKIHFDKWLSLFYETVDELFTGGKAKEAKWRASKMAEMFQYKIQYYRNNPAKPLI